MPKPNKKLFLLDAMALLYRAYFAFRKHPRINSKGVNTSAVLGFTNSLVEILYTEVPTHIAVAFDTNAPTFRHQAFKAYKAHREAQPEAITIAIPYVKALLKAFQIPVLEKAGYEADDIIGTLARKAAQARFDVYLVTIDKDFAQLVDEHIYLYKPAFLGNGVTILGKKEILAQWGIEHVAQVKDLIGLQGDAVDNIPGIPNIGPKTAQKLLKTFGSVENLVANATQLTGKLQATVVTYGQQGIQSKALATIHTAVPLQFDLAQSQYQGPDTTQLTAILQELEFRTLAQRLLGPQTVSTTKAPGLQTTLFDPPMQTPFTVPTLPPILATRYTQKHQYHLIDTPALRKSLVYYLTLQDAFSLHTEATSLDPHQAKLMGIAFSYYPGEAYYVPIPENDPQANAIVHEFKTLFESTTHCKIGYNLKYTISLLQRYGITVNQPLFDIILAHYLLEPDKSHQLHAMAASYLHYKLCAVETFMNHQGKSNKNQAVALAEVKEYAGEKAAIILQLKQIVQPALAAQQLAPLFYNVEIPLVQVLATMEQKGVKIDLDVLKTLASTMAEESKVLAQEIYALAGKSFNIDSPKQLGDLLFSHLKLAEKPPKTKAGYYATREEVLTKLTSKHPIAAKIIEYRALKKLQSTYVVALPNLISPIDGRLHTSYNQTIVTTGRLSATNPNLQNIPIRTDRGREIRKAFVPSSPAYVLLSADYSQIELRIMAAFAKDSTMLAAFKVGTDIHRTTASKLFQVPLDAVDRPMRRKAKIANFGILYGISAFGLAQRLHPMATKEAATIIHTYFEAFPAVKAYIAAVIHQARRQGYVTTLMGRKKFLPDINSRNATVRGFAERNAINAPIQGSAAEMIKLAMIHIHAWLQKENLQSKMIMQVHDELVFEVPHTEVDQLKVHIPLLMKNALPLEVPIEVAVNVGDNWLTAHA